MLDNKNIDNIKKNIKLFLNDGSLYLSKPSKFAEFFINNSANSLNSARLLFEVSTDIKLQESAGFPGFNGFLWAINAGYYSMFYLARALLENQGIKIRTDSASVHLITFDALVYYFYLTGKIEKSLIDEFKEAGEEASEILGKEKASSLIQDYSYEKEKRSRFTYEMGELAVRGKAETSLRRAERFFDEINKLIKNG